MTRTMRIPLLLLAVAAAFTTFSPLKASATLLSASQAAALQTVLRSDPPHRLTGLMTFGIPEHEVYSLLLQDTTRAELEHGDRDCVGMVGEEASRHLSEPEELPPVDMRIQLMVDINTQRCMHDAPSIPWSDCTARGAQKWAGQDRVEPLASYLEPPCGGPAGRAYTWGVPVQEAVQRWVEEEGVWEEGAQKTYNAAAANYTTMVWRGVRNFGCGWEGNEQLLICHFKADDYFNCRTPLTEGCFEYHVHVRNAMGECDCRNQAVTFAYSQFNMDIPELADCAATTTTTEVPRDWWREWTATKHTAPSALQTADLPAASTSVFQRLRAQAAIPSEETAFLQETETDEQTPRQTPNRPVKGVIDRNTIFQPGSWMFDPTKQDPTDLQTSNGNAVLETQVPRFRNGSQPFRTLKVEFPTEEPLAVGGLNLVQLPTASPPANTPAPPQGGATPTTPLPAEVQQKWEFEGVWGPGMVPDAPVKPATPPTNTQTTRVSLRAAGGNVRREGGGGVGVRRHGFVL